MNIDNDEHSVELKADDLDAIKQIREILDNFYPEVRKAILEYCLFVTEKDLEG